MESFAVVVGNGFMPRLDQVQRISDAGHVRRAVQLTTYSDTWRGEAQGKERASAIAIRELNRRGYRGKGKDFTLSRLCVRFGTGEEFVVATVAFGSSSRRPWWKFWG